MMIAPTLEGGLRIDAESHLDWMMLEHICSDAALSDVPIHEKLSCHVEDDEDWEEYIKPELRVCLAEQLRTISVVITSAARDVEGGGSLIIPKESAMEWYGAINQARLALEGRHNLSRLPLLDEKGLMRLSEETKAAFGRCQFYQQLQSVLLQFVMK